MRILSRFISSFHHIDLLEDIQKNQEKEEHKPFNHRPLIKHLNERAGISDKKTDKALDYLIKFGYLAVGRPLASFLFITDAGKTFLQNYYRNRTKAILMSIVGVIGFIWK
jgi:hypothetical protein